MLTGVAMVYKTSPGKKSAANHHCDLQVPLAISVLLDPRMIKDRLYSTTSTSTTMLAVASGYFVHDLVVCAIQLPTWGPAYLFHALFCSLLYCYGFFSQVLHYYGTSCPRSHDAAPKTIQQCIQSTFAFICGMQLTAVICCQPDLLTCTEW